MGWVNGNDVPVFDCCPVWHTSLAGCTECFYCRSKIRFRVRSPEAEEEHPWRIIRGCRERHPAVGEHRHESVSPHGDRDSEPSGAKSKNNGGTQAVSK